MSKLAVVVVLIALSAVAEGRDVVALVKKGDMHELVKTVPETPPDKPDKDGHTPLMAAVLRDEIEIADLLLSYKANGSVVEPASGATPLGMSFSKGKHGMARLLLSFGASPDAKDKFGKAARQLAGKDAELKKLLEAFDKDGAAAFEDAPGTWQRHIADDHGNIPFYYNPKTGVSRYQAPPSCSWIKASVDGHPIYVNTLTHQTQWVVPTALAWRRLIDPKTKDSYWYNYRANVALADAPAELPPDLATEMIYETGLFWHNDVTGESTFHNPHEGNWREVLDPSGRKFWYHPETLESTWERPSDLSWRQVPSHEHEGMRFWFNDKLQESTWEKPPAVAWSEQRM